MQIKSKFIFTVAAILTGVGCISPEERTPVRCTHFRQITMDHAKRIAGGNYTMSSSSTDKHGRHVVYYCDGWGYMGGFWSSDHGRARLSKGHPLKKYFQCNICKKQGLTLYEMRAHFDKMVEADKNKVVLDPKSWDTHRREHLKWFSFLRP